MIPASIARSRTRRHLDQQNQWDLYEDCVYRGLRSNTLSVYSWCTIIADRLAGKDEKFSDWQTCGIHSLQGFPVFLTASHMTTAQGTEERAYCTYIVRSVVSTSSIFNCQYIII